MTISRFMLERTFDTQDNCESFEPLHSEIE